MSLTYLVLIPVPFQVTKATGWTPTTKYEDIVKEMVEEDLRIEGVAASLAKA